MARRNRTRSRSRREAVASRRAAAPRQPTEREAAPRPTGYRARGTVSRLGYSRAVGAPSAALERASLLERSFITKDFRRLGLTVAIALALLIAAGLIESALLGR
ncbi:MAG TPA: hypothetical protein VGQ86_11335 [Candidatus Limnocylindria bacterium]|nr:hypothetical protein [Candidatus Limnocylindria bacterium]